MTPAEHIATLNRTPEHRARSSARATARNRANQYRAGKYSVPDAVVEAMADMRQRGKSYGQIGMRFGLSPSGARHRIERRGGLV